MQELNPQPDFLVRHLGPSDDEIALMLSATGYPSLEELCNAVVPAAIRAHEPLDLPNPLTEVDAIAQIQRIASLNKPMKSLIEWTAVRNIGVD
mgnify:CR=1 FL=1